MSFAQSVKGKNCISFTKQIKESARFWQKKTTGFQSAFTRGQKFEDSLQYPGIARLNSLIDDFMNAMAEWQPYQCSAFMSFVNTMICHILGSDSDTCLERVMKVYHWLDTPDEMLVAASRGCGKSTLLSCFAAACLKNIPSFTATTYSGVQRKGNDLLISITTAFMGMCKRDPNCTILQTCRIKQTKEELSFAVDDTDFRQVLALSAIGQVRIKKIRVGMEPIQREWRVCVCAYYPRVSLSFSHQRARKYTLLQIHEDKTQRERNKTILSQKSGVEEKRNSKNFSPKQ